MKYAIRLFVTTLILHCVCTGAMAQIHVTTDSNADGTSESEDKIDTLAAINKLTPEEEAAGWQLLFNGQDLKGWHNFKRDTIRPGWQVLNGALVCVDPHNAGDLCTEGQVSFRNIKNRPIPVEK